MNPTLARILGYTWIFALLLVFIIDTQRSRGRKPDKYRKKLGKFYIPHTDQVILAIIFVVSFIVIVAIL